MFNFLDMFNSNASLLNKISTLPLYTAIFDDKSLEYNDKPEEEE